jgi:hypothetical protein
VAAAPGLAVVADSDLGVRVIDVSTPATPTEVGFAPTAAGAHRVAVAGDLAYVANRQTGLDIVDLSMPSAPTVVGSYEMATGHGLSVLGHHVFLAANVGDLLVVDVSQPTIPLVAGNLSLAGLAVDTAVAGNLLAVASSDLANAVLTIVDVTVPPYPVELGALVRPGWPKRVAFDGHRAYLAIGGYGLTLVDVSDPAAPHETATFDAGPWTGALDVAIAHNHAFVADSAGGLRVVNVANPLWPREVGWYEASGAAGVDVRGGEAYLSTVDGGLLLLDVSGCVGELLVDGFESGDVAGWSAGG